MPGSDDKPSFWTTLPGVLTGLATLLTAATGLYLAIHHAQPAESAPPQTTISSQGTGAAGTTPPKAVTADARVPDASPDSKVTVRSRKGETTQVALRSFRHNMTEDSLTLASGQSVAFDKLRSIDFLTVNDDAHLVAVKLTLLDGGTAAGDLATNYAFKGDSDLGPLTIFVQDVRQITFNR